MPGFQALRAFRDEDVPTMRQGQFNDVVSTIPPITTAPLNDYAAQPTTEHLPLPTSALQSGPLTPISGPLSDMPPTQSLIAALQSTLPGAPRSRTIVIPGSHKKRPSLASQASQQNASPQRISPKIRYAITLGSFVGVLLMTLLSLAPLDNGQSSFHLFGTVIQWAQAQQQNWNILAHTMPIVQDAANAPVTTTAPAPVSAPINLPKSQYVAIAQQDAVSAGISPDYFVRQINQESGFNPNAISPAGAVGIAQFEPGTAAGLGINPYDPVQSLQAAARLMASYANQYGGNYAMALAAYNGGSGTVQNAINTCGAANWMNCLPAETRSYIAVIMGI